MVNELSHLFFCVVLFSACASNHEHNNKGKSNNLDETENKIIPVSTTNLVVLGTIQDAGSPHIDCHQKCCEHLHSNPDPSRMVVSLGFIDPENEQKFLFEASPDLPRQLSLLSNYEEFSTTDNPDGIFLTHAHIGHYTGLMYFGKEANDATEIPVFAMPKMKLFLENNGPWNQLVTNKNIIIKELEQAKPLRVSSNLAVQPIIVPHRDEYSETVGYKIFGPNKTALFIPDIDKWNKWELDILKEIKEVDYAFLDATFFSRDEISTREISEIPHPLVSESMELFSVLSQENKGKIYFIHINHSNPILDVNSGVKDKIENAGYHVAQINDLFEM